jgi:hypothetical protein
MGSLLKKIMEDLLNIERWGMYLFFFKEMGFSLKEVKAHSS